MSIAILGAGAFGTALAQSLAQHGPVLLYARDPQQAQTMRDTGENTARLPGVKISEAVTVTTDLSQAARADILLLSVPLQSLRTFVLAMPDFGRAALVACCKGIERQSGRGPVSILAEVAPQNPAALLSGPSFAQDIAQGLPTALTLACAQDKAAERLQAALTTANLRLYRTNDVVGAEIGGALKNVIAIACGAALGAGLGESARAAVMTRGFAEMRRVAALRKARPETLTGLSGFGDLALTCTSPQSRNFRLGQTLGRGESFDPGITVEGVATARAMLETAWGGALELPITTAVVDLVDGRRSVRDAMTDLLSRPLRAE